MQNCRVMRWSHVITVVLLLWTFKSVNSCFVRQAKYSNSFLSLRCLQQSGRGSYCTRCRVRGTERSIRTSRQRVTGVCWAERTDGLSDMNWKPWPFFPAVRYSSTHQCLSMNTKIDLLGKHTLTLDSPCFFLRAVFTRSSLVCIMPTEKWMIYLALHIG